MITRSFALVVVCVLFFVGVLSTSILLTISSSLEYEHIKSELSSILAETGKNVLNTAEDYNKTLNELIEEQYYKEYNCEFWSCIENADEGGPFVLMSKYAHDYWTSKFYLALLISIVLFILIILFVENKSNSFILAGILILISAFPLLALGKLSTFSADSILQILTTFVSQANSVFVKIIIFGFVILILGIVFKAFHVGVWISDKINGIRDKTGVKKK